MADPNTPALQPPGAGLPWWERLAAKYVVVPRTFHRLGWAGATALFQEEGSRALALWDALPPDRLGERVLVRRLPGMEDSSRFWSAEMTVEHLTIVGTNIRGVLRGLRAGIVPARAARVEDVKPKGEGGAAAVRAAFVQLLAEAAEDAATEPPVAPGAGPRFAHPWFGPFDAYQWYCMRATHQGIHRRRLEAIHAGLGAA